MVTRSQDYYNSASEAWTKQALITSVINRFLRTTSALFKPRYVVQVMELLHRGPLSLLEFVRDPLKWMRAPPAQSREYY